MTLPPFDVFGNLSVGRLFGRDGSSRFSLVTTPLHEIHERFVQGHAPQRARIWDGWMRHRQRLDALPLPYHTLVNGSFVTNKSEPNDVDVCLIYDARIANRLPPNAKTELQAILDQGQAARDHLMDLYHFGVYPFEDGRFLAAMRQFSYWTRVFGIDRFGRQKCFVAVPGGGTP